MCGESRTIAVSGARFQKSWRLVVIRSMADGLTDRIDGLTDRIDGLTNRIDGLVTAV